MKTTILSMFSLIAMSLSAADYEVSSPNGRVKVTVTAVESVTWSVTYDGKTVLLPSEINIQLQQGNKTLGLGKIGKVAKNQIKSSFEIPFYKKSLVRDDYGQLLLYSNQKMTIEVRAYNDGAAYRLISNHTKPTLVKDEMAEYCFAANYQAFVPYVNDNRSGERYCYSFESYYDEQLLSDMFYDSLAITPLAVCLSDDTKNASERELLKAIVMDAGVENYPGMMLVKSDKREMTNNMSNQNVQRSMSNVQRLKAVFAPYALEQAIGGFDRLNLIPTRRADYIAQLNGRQALPWRAIVITEKDADILNCDMAQRLAPACRIADTSWIRPGKVAWDWWNNTNVTGVDFASGMNTNTYLYYIDFAAKNHLEYIIIDEGWSGKESLMIDLNPDIDLQKLIAYGREKGVGIILWSSWRNLIGNDPMGGNSVSEKVMSHYANMGIKGFKVDFFDRDDQQVIASAYQLAECAARNQLLLDYHGLKPFGIQRAYPNVVNFEGVKGLENSKWEPRVGDGPLHNQPRYDVTAPYLRMLAGPMDYTPGAMTNAMKDNFFGNNNHPMSQGTRVHQMAMYVTFEAPLQMLADSPTKYMQNQECTDFIAQIPTTFDETVALDGQLGAYTLIARRKGDVWYLAGMTDWTPRNLTVDLSFLSLGQHIADIFVDGINASKDATDYQRIRQTVSASDRLSIHMGSGGGWVAIIR